MQNQNRFLTQKLKIPSSRTMSIPVFAAFLLVVSGLFLSSFQAAHAQGTMGSITGTVSDPSGAVIPGATVTVKEINTNAVKTAVTSDVGTYTVTPLPPGNYTVKVEKVGFSAKTQTGIVLVIDQSALINVQLSVGSQEQMIEVTDASAVIQTEDSSVGQVIDSKSIQNTPLNGRLSVMGLIALAPGMQGVGAQDQMATRGLTFAAGTGSRNSYGGVGTTFDGVINKEVTLQRSEPEIPSLDALSQFKVLSTGAPAEFNEPTQVIVVSSSGTNAFHGELFEFNRSKGTAAKSYFNGATARPPYERNEFGGNFAGPIVIPKLYNGKDRSFFFFAYEAFHLTQSAALSSQQPTALERTGVFTEFTTTIKDPVTGLPFSNNTIPTSRINSVSQALMNKLMPMPTTSGTGTNTFENVPYNSDVERISLRADHRINDKNSVRFTWLRAFYGPNVTVGADSLAGGVSGDGEHNSQFILGYTHTFSPTLVLDMNGDFFHLPIYRTPQNVNTKWESIIPGLVPQAIEGAPGITIANITSVSEAGSKDLEQVGQLNSSLTKVLPRHTIKFGGSYLYDNHWNISASRPSFTFANQYTGLAFADFLLGLPASTSQTTPSFATTRNISSQWAGYVQDDWKPAPRLTVNAGVRYDLQWFSPGDYNQNSLWVPSLNKVVVFGDSYPSSAVPQYLSLLQTNNLASLSKDAGISNNPFAYLGRPTTNFAPRVGFAYQLMINTVVRGAYGIYFNLLPASYVGAMFVNLPFKATLNFTNSAYSPTSTVTMSAPFAGTGTAAGRPSVGAEHSLVTPYTEEYNLAIEHQFRHGMDVRVGYVGQHNLKQNNFGGNGTVTPNLNYADPFDITKTSAAQAPIQALGTINYNIDPIFHSIMNSLQVGAHKQYTNGVAFGAEYQWTRVLGTENIEDPSGKYPRDSYGPIAAITPQVLQLNYSYALPIGKGRLFFANANPIVNKAVGGWEVSGVVTAQSGQPFSVSYTASTAKYVGAVSGRANVVPGVALYPQKKTRSQWFNPSAFTAPTDANGIQGGAFGTSGYDMLRGPKYQNWDMNLKKNTAWGDHYNVQLRADAFNMFNHPNFGTPNANISNSNVATITGTSGTPSYQARTLEFAVKFTF